MRALTSIRSKTIHAILLVDDNRHGLLARRSLLEDEGYRISTATNGEDALEAFAEEGFDLVITDFKMSRMNGIELIRQIRRLRPNTPIILLSGFVEPLGLDERSTDADVVIAKGANEVAHMLRAVSRISSGRLPRKPPTTQRARARSRAGA
ncbi:MAG: response regulator [Bryobacteraceae bacterium]